MAVNRFDPRRRRALGLLSSLALRLARSFDPTAPPDAEVPDPYYGDQAAFDQVFDVCLAACRGILAAFPPPTSPG